MYVCDHLSLCDIFHFTYSNRQVLGRKPKKKNMNKHMVLTSTYDGNGGSTIKALPKTNDIPSALYVLTKSAMDTFRQLTVKGKKKVRPRYRHDGAHAGRKAGRTAAERYATLLRDGVEYDCIVSYDRLCPHHGREIAKSLRDDSSLKIRHIYLAPDSSLSTVSMYVIEYFRERERE